MTKISIIIIGRNEEQHIERCMRAVMKGVKTISDSEIIYSDSASTDRTIERVQPYPAIIVQLKSDWPLCAAAGRYIGFLHSRGEYLFFIDGDSILHHDWLPKGIRYLEQHQDTGAVAGSVHEIFEDESGHAVTYLRHRYGKQDTPREEKTLGGIALYRKSVLDETGPFNPYIAVDEERELGLRIRRAGYKLIRIPDSMAITYGPFRESFRELQRRSRSGLYSFGKTLRYCQRNGFFHQYMKERLGFITSFLFAVVILLAGLIFAVCKGWFLYGFSFLLFGLIILKILKPAVFNRMSISFIKRTLMTFWTIKSFLQTKPKSIETYPIDAIIIRSGNSS